MLDSISRLVELAWARGHRYHRDVLALGKVQCGNDPVDLKLVHLTSSGCDTVEAACRQQHWRRPDGRDDGLDCEEQGGKQEVSYCRSTNSKYLYGKSGS